MTLFASLASMFCTLSLGSAAPAVAVVPVENVNRVEIISPIAEGVDSSAVFEVDFQLGDNPGENADFAQEPFAAPDVVADNSDAASDEELLPADVVVDDSEILPADVVVADELLPADVVTADDEEILPADVIADSEAGVVDDAIADVEAEGFALAEAAASTEPLKDEEPGAPPSAPAEEERSDPSGDPSSDGEAAS